jgi:hypothetical protein
MSALAEFLTNGKTTLPVSAKLQGFIDYGLPVVAETASNTKRSSNDDRASYKNTHECSPV